MNRNMLSLKIDMSLEHILEHIFSHIHISFKAIDKRNRLSK